MNTARKGRVFCKSLENRPEFGKNDFQDEKIILNFQNSFFRMKNASGITKNQKNVGFSLDP